MDNKPEQSKQLIQLSYEEVQKQLKEVNGEIRLLNEEIQTFEKQLAVYKEKMRTLENLYLKANAVDCNPRIKSYLVSSDAQRIYKEFDILYISANFNNNLRNNSIEINKLCQRINSKYSDLKDKINKIEQIIKVRNSKITQLKKVLSTLWAQETRSPDHKGQTNSTGGSTRKIPVSKR